MYRAVIFALAIMLTPLSGKTVLPETSMLTVDFSVPGYTVTKAGSYDYVDIPGGGVLFEEEGCPRVPYFVYTIDLEEGWRVQDVSLLQRSEPESEFGLNLPLATVQWTLTKPITPKTGWYPETVFEWNQVAGTGGKQVLDIVVYPVCYNQQTQELLFYRDYSFSVYYVKSSIEIMSLNTDKPSYSCGETVNIEAEITSQNEAQDIYMDVVILRYGPEDLADSLPVRLLRDVSGNCSVSAVWDSAGFTPGSYYARMVLSDEAGNIIDANSTAFGLSDTTQKPEDKTTTAAGNGSGLATLLKFIKEWIYYIAIGAGILLVVIILLVIRSKSRK